MIMTNAVRIITMIARLWSCFRGGPNTGDTTRSSAQDAHAPDSFNFRLCILREITCFHDDWLRRELPFAQDLHVAPCRHVDHRRFISPVLPKQSLLLRRQRPQLINVDSRDYVALLDEVKVTHAYLPKVARMVFVEVDTVMMLPSRFPTTSWVLAVFSDTATTRRHLTTRMSVFLQTRSHCNDSFFEIRPTMARAKT